MPVKRATETQKKEKKAIKTSKQTTPQPKLEDFLAEIQKRAYEIYIERTRNGLPGDDMSDWLQAEKEIKSKYNIK